MVSGGNDGTGRIRDCAPRAERWQQIRAAKKLRRVTEPGVDRLFEELTDLFHVIDHLRAEENLSDDFPRTALRVLLERLMADRPYRE